MKYVIMFMGIGLLAACAPNGEREKVEEKDIEIENGEVTKEPVEDNVYRDFLDNLRDMCGQSFAGEAVFHEEDATDFIDQELVMTFVKCEDDKIHIPLRVGENRSRTWMLEMKDDKLTLKHDHRHEDGTPEDLTMYGGVATDEGTAWSQFFPADDETAEMLPEASTNVWNMVIHPDREEFEYILHRHGNLRFHAVFDLSTPVEKD